MRMQDGPTVEVTIRVEAAPGRVWELVTDLALVGEWSPEYQGGNWQEGTDGPAVGAWFKGRNRRATANGRAIPWSSKRRPARRLPGP